MFHVAYACNEAYKEQTLVSIVSLCSSCRQDDITIFLIEDGMKKASISDVSMIVKKYRKQLKVISLQVLLKDIYLDQADRHPRTIYAKLFLADICQADRILYLDSDTVILKSLSSLMNMDLCDVYAAGVQMPYTEKKKVAVGLFRNVPYLCDGILLINLEKWRCDHLKEKCISHIRKYIGAPPMLSEGTLNCVFHGRIKLLPPEYNLMSGMIRWDGKQMAKLYGVSDYYGKEEIEQARENPVVIHYLDELYIRPWFQNSDHPYRNIYRYYFRTVEEELRICHKNMRLLMEDNKKIRTGKLRMRTRMVRIIDDLLPFWLFSKIYRMVKG